MFGNSREWWTSADGATADRLTRFRLANVGVQQPVVVRLALRAKGVSRNQTRVLIAEPSIEILSAVAEASVEQQERTAAPERCVVHRAHQPLTNSRSSPRFGDHHLLHLGAVLPVGPRWQRELARAD